MTATWIAANLKLAKRYDTRANVAVGSTTCVLPATYSILLACQRVRQGGKEAGGGRSRGSQGSGSHTSRPAMRAHRG